MNPQDWRSDAFRNDIRNKIANAMQSLGSPPQAHPPSHMEEQMFNRSKSAEDYLSYVNKLLKLLHERRQQPMATTQGSSSFPFGILIIFWSFFFSSPPHFKSGWFLSEPLADLFTLRSKDSQKPTNFLFQVAK